MRFILGALLWLLAPVAAIGQPTLDTGSYYTAKTSGTTAIAVNASTSGANEYVVVIASAGSQTYSNPTPMTISGCGLTWTQIAGNSNNINSSQTTGATAWLAFSAPTLSVCSVSVTASTAVDDWAVGSFAVAGALAAGPLDPNAALPVINGDGTGAIGSGGANYGGCTSAYRGAVFSTTSAKTLVITAMYSDKHDPINPPCIPGNTNFIGVGEWDGSWYEYLRVYSDTYTTAQTNTVSGILDISGAPVASFVFAFTSTPPTPPGGPMLVTPW